MFSFIKRILVLFIVFFMFGCVQKCTDGRWEKTTVNTFVNDGSHDTPVDRYELIRNEKKDVVAVIDRPATKSLWLKLFECVILAIIAIVIFFNILDKILDFEDSGGARWGCLIFLFIIVLIIAIKPEMPSDPNCHGELFFIHRMYVSGQLLNDQYEPVKNVSIGLALPTTNHDEPSMPSEYIVSDIDKEGYFRYAGDIASSSSDMKAILVFDSGKLGNVVYRYPFDGGIANYKNGEKQNVKINGRVIILPEKSHASF